MGHRIVNEPTKFFRGAARLELKGRWLEAAVVCGIFTIMVGIVSFIANNTVHFGVGLISALYTWAIFGPATVGLYAYFMRLIRRQDPTVMTVFEGFEDLGRSLVLGLLILLKVMLWCLLFIIPGIIAAYRYSMAPMLMRDHPEWTPYQCIQESKRLMVGNKGSLFTLDISFIGWYILACLPAAIFQAAYRTASGIDDIASMGLMINLVLLIFEIPLLFVTAYNSASHVVFYEELNRPVEVFTGFSGFSGGYGDVH